MSFDVIPIWGVFLATVALIVVALEAGFRIGRILAQRGTTKSDVSGAMVGASMGLLAFLMAFTFNAAAARHEARRLLVIDDANAIEKTWLRAGFLADSERVEVRRLLAEYVALRIKVVNGETAIAPAVERSDSLHAQLWSVAARAGKQEPASIMVGLFVSSLNEMIDVQLKRVTIGARNRVAPTIWFGLYLLAVMAMAMMGIQNGLADSRQRGIEFALAITFALVLFLIADLDRPQEGLVNVSQQALVELQEKLRH